MKHLNAITKLTVLVMFSLVMIAVRFAVWPVALISRKTDRRIRRGLLRFWATVFAWVVGIRIITIGPRPRPPFYLVMNHLTYFDMLVLGRETGCIFVSREDVQHWPILGLIAKSLYILFIDRSRPAETVRVNEEIKQTLKEGDGIGVFLESRVSPGLTIEPFKSPLLQSAIELNIPVHYATLSYRTPEGCPVEGEIVSWWRNEPFYVHLYRFLQYPGATATIHFCEEPIFDLDRKQLAQRLHAEVLKNFKPLRLAIETYAEPNFRLKNPYMTKEEPASTNPPLKSSQG